MLAERHVDGELLKSTTGELGGHLVAHGAELLGAVQHLGSCHVEAEVVVEIDRLCVDEVGGRGLLVLGSREVDVLGRACSRSES